MNKKVNDEKGDTEEDSEEAAEKEGVTAAHIDDRETEVGDAECVRFATYKNRNRSPSLFSTFFPLLSFQLSECLNH